MSDSRLFFEMVCEGLSRLSLEHGTLLKPIGQLGMTMRRLPTFVVVTMSRAQLCGN